VNGTVFRNGVTKGGVARKGWTVLSAVGEQPRPRIENASTSASSNHRLGIFDTACYCQLLHITWPSSWPSLASWYAGLHQSRAQTSTTIQAVSRCSQWSQMFGSPHEWTRNFVVGRSDGSRSREKQTSRVREITARASFGGEPPHSSPSSNSAERQRRSRSYCSPARTTAAPCRRRARRSSRAAA
jgi:hypothetical protein